MLSCLLIALIFASSPNLTSRTWTKLAYVTSERRAVGLYRYLDAKGQSALNSPKDYLDAATAVASGVAGKTFGFRFTLPWLTFPSIRYLDHNLNRDAVVFEWGSGNSTVWFTNRGCRVYSVEDNPGWYEYVKHRAPKAAVYLLRGTDYVNKIDEFPPNSFDLIVVDGLDRLACFERAHGHLKRGGLLLLDDTDLAAVTSEVYRMEQSLRSHTEYDILRFTGWVPGNFHPIETTICIKTR